MARPVDEKIVVMKLDNSDFAAKAAETTSMFGKLRDALNKIPGVNLGKTAKELNQIQTEAQPDNMNKLGQAVQTVASRFSALGIMGVTALQNITNRAVDAGVAMAKSLTLEPVSAGFNEYELKIGAIGTMLSNTEWEGGNLESINAVLADLNTYADNTVYSFAHMTENIGRFTAAGVGMKDSAIAIKGLSNLAAASGSDVNQLNTAMYQMSQSMAAGTMNLMDWNSLVNAGMAGKKTQDALLETAKAMGVNVDMSEGFRNSISQGWLSSEIFLETMKKFGEDESMTEAATAVRTFTGMMDSLKESIGSGWAATFETIFGDFEEATKFWTTLSNSVTGFFSSSSESRNKFVADLARRNGFKNIFEGIANAAKPIGQVFKAIGDGFEKAFPPKSVYQIALMTKSFKEFTAGLKMSDSTVAKLTTVFQGIFSVFSSVIEIAKQLGKALLKLIPEGAGGGILDILENVALMAIAFNKSIKEGNALTGTIEVLGNVFATFADVLSTIGGGVAKFAGFLKDNLGTAIDWIKDKLAPVGNYFKDAFGSSLGDEALGIGAIAGIILIVKKVTGFFDGLSDGFGDIVDNISGMFEGVGDAINEFTSSVKYVNLLLIAVALATLAASLKTLDGIDAENIAKGITTLAIVLGTMLGAMMLMGKFNITGGLGAATTMVVLAIAVKMMASSLEDLSELKVDEIGRGMLALAGITAILTASLVAISKLGGKIGVSSLGLLALAAAVVILSDAVVTMSDINPKDLAKGLLAMTAIFAQLAIFLKVVNKSKFGPGSALGVIGIAVALKLMVDAVAGLGDMDIDELGKGLGSIAILLATIGTFSSLAGGPKMMAAGVGILLIAGAVNALVGPVQDLGNMSIVELAKGLTAMAIALGIVAGAAMLASGSIGGAVAITVMALALNLLMVPLKAMAEMTWGELLKAFIGLAGGMALLAGASLLLTPAVPSMLAFGAGLLVLGAAVALAGAGVALFGIGLATLATLTATSVAAIVSALALLISGLVTLIPATVNFIVELGLALVNGLKKLVPPLLDTLMELIMKLLTVIDENLPEFIEKGVSIVTKLIQGIGESVGPLVDAGLNLIINFINGLADAIEQNGPTLISAVLNLLGEIIILFVEAGVQVINALFGWIPGVKSVTSKIGETAEDYIRDNFGAESVGKDKGKEFGKALEGTKGDSQKAGKAIADAGKKAAEGVKMDSAGKDFGQGFANGIGAKIGAVTTAAKNLASAAKRKVESWLGIASPAKAMIKDGGWFGEGFAIGIANKVKRVGDEAKNMAMVAKNSVYKFMDGFDLPDSDNEIHIKAVIDYEGFNPNDLPSTLPISMIPNTDITTGLASATRAEIRQNAYNPPREVGSNTTTNETINQYDIQINAQSITSKAEIRRLAEELQVEIKNTNDRARMSRGEVVVY